MGREISCLVLKAHVYPKFRLPYKPICCKQCLLCIHIYQNIKNPQYNLMPNIAEVLYSIVLYAEALVYVRNEECAYYSYVPCSAGNGKLVNYANLILQAYRHM